MKRDETQLFRTDSFTEIFLLGREAKRGENDGILSHARNVDDTENVALSPRSNLSLSRPSNFLHTKLRVNHQISNAEENENDAVGRVPYMFCTLSALLEGTNTNLLNKQSMVTLV